MTGCLRGCGRHGGIVMRLPILLVALWAAGVSGEDGNTGAVTAESAEPVATTEESPGAGGSADWSGVARLKERIEGEIVELEALAAAQAALAEWNRARSAADLPPAALSPDVCVGDALEKWCGLLTATFGGFREDGEGGRADVER